MNAVKRAVLALLIIAPLTAVHSQDNKAVELFNGKDLTGWKAQWDRNAWKAASAVTVGKENNQRFEIADGQGILVNGDRGRTTNLFTEYEHGDCQLHIEFTVPNGSNSGVYFQGLYEIQVLDSFGKEDGKLEFSDCGAIYARYNETNDSTYEGHPPRVNASKAPGEWQTFDATFRAPRFDENGKKIENARFVKVVHNGVVVHENVEVTGGTRACMDREESPKGPLMLQGDHGPVAYRNIQITPLSLD